MHHELTPIMRQTCTTISPPGTVPQATAPGAHLYRTSEGRGRVIDSGVKYVICACADNERSKISQEIHLVVNPAIA